MDTGTGTGFIDKIFNNSGRDYEIESRDTRLNGGLQPLEGGHVEDMMYQGYKDLLAHRSYKLQWCRVPKFKNRKYFKRYRVKGTYSSADWDIPAVMFYCYFQDGQNWIYFQDQNGFYLIRQAVPNEGDFHLTLRFEDDGMYVNVIGLSTEFECKEKGRWEPASESYVAAKLRAIQHTENFDVEYGYLGHSNNKLDTANVSKGSQS